MASVLTDSMPEVLNLGQTHPAFLWVEFDVRAAAANVHLAIVVEELLLGLTEDDNVVEVALNVQRLTEQSQARLKAIETALANTDVQ